MSTGNPMGGVVNTMGGANGNFTMSLNNLSADTYTLTMLVGRGNPYGAGYTSSFSLSGDGVNNISAVLDDYFHGFRSHAERFHRDDQYAYRRLGGHDLYV